MKKIILCLGIGFISLLTMAQNGLKSVIVEKYYISNANDSNHSVGTLLSGSVTYRIYLEMERGYKFESLYGDQNHELRFETSTYFFNNEDYGSNIANNITLTQEKNNTVLLDSWLTAGAACKGYYGVPKSKDDGVNTVVNANGILKNNDTLAGIPLSQQDGLLQAKTSMPQLMTANLVGFDLDSAHSISNFLDNSNTSNSTGQVLFTKNGSMYVANGAYGPDSVNNNVILIAQLTTNGIFSYKLNVQLGSPGVNSNAIDYVASNPIPNKPSPNVPETTIAGLQDTIYPPSYKPTASKILPNNNKIQVYPNPISDNVTIEFTDLQRKGNIQLFNVIGNLVFSKQIDNQIEHISTASFANGLYFLVIQTGVDKSVYKLIKK